VALIGLISDLHATPKPVAEALSIFVEAGVDHVLCAGDIAGYNDKLSATIELLLNSDCQTIKGNHDYTYIEQHKDEKRVGSDPATLYFLKNLATTFTSVIEGKSLFMVHAQPPDVCHGGIKLLDKNAEKMPDKVVLWEKKLQSFKYDVLIVGHTHQVFSEKIGHTLVINPGSSAFNNSCAILTLPQMTVQFFALSNKPIESTWNWGEHMIYGRPA